MPAMTTIAAAPSLAQPRPTRVGTQTDLLGECPLWDERLQCLWWVDIRAPSLRCWTPARQALQTWPMPELVGSIALTERDGVVLVALRSRLALFDSANDSFDTVAQASLPPDHRFNDGRCDRQGRFWVGTMHHVTRASEGSLFRLDAQGLREVIAGGIAIPNSLAFSPDGRTMYFADSLQHRIDAFGYDPASGTRGAARALAAIERPAFPDGACVDADGFLWSAQFHNARLVRYAPDGRIDRTLAVPMKRPTCCTFGGADFGTLYVTGVSHSMSDAERAADPQAGALFAFDVGRTWGIHGLPEPRLGLH
jgi:sugar lactone lactonase YvrE